MLVFFPLAGLIFNEKKLVSDLYQEGWNQNWKLFDDQKNLLDGDLTLPQDLRHHPLGKQKNHWIFEKEIILSSAFKKLDRPTLVLGRLGDSDEVRINGCFVGSTGLTKERTQEGWMWGVLRSYEVPSGCLVFKKNSNTPLKLSIEVFHWGVANYGIFAGPIGVGEFSKIKKRVGLIDFFRFQIFCAFGILLIGIGFYYLFVFLLAPARSYNGIFAAFAFCIGTFEIMVSSIPYRISSEGLFPVRINFLSAVLGSWTFILFLYFRFKCFHKSYVILIGIINFIFLLMGMPKGSLDGVFEIYNYWLSFFLLTFLISYAWFLLNYKKNRDSDGWRYILGYSIFIVCSVHDVIVSLSHQVSVYLLPYGFMVMLGAIALALAKEYADAFLHVEVQVGERTQDLKNALNQLRSLEKMKEKFFANVSHDFKTPIAVALGSIEEAKNKNSTSDSKELVHAERSLLQLLGMIQDLLDTVKAESGTLKLQWEKAPVATLLKDWISSYEVLCRTKNLTLEFSFEGFENLWVPMDILKTRRVIENLLSNAIKFTSNNTHSEGKIQVGIRTDEARMYIEINDSGIGVPPEEREKIFDRYFQSSRTSLKEHGGSGIGLSFVKEILEAQNGRVWVEDSPLGGSKFVVALPLSQEVEISAVPSEGAPLDSKLLHGSLDVSYPPERPEENRPGIPSVLFAEDNPEIAQIVYSALSSEYNTHFAPNGQKAWERFQSETFDCLVTDLVMPQMRGEELIRKIREATTGRAIPIIILSSHGEEQIITELLRKGANDYITKPFRREVLAARVRAQIQTHQMTEWISQNEKVVELGFLAGGMAHQIRNGLNSLKNQISYQQKISSSLLDEVSDLPEDQTQKLRDRLKESTEIISRAMDRIERLTDSVRTYSSGSRQKVEICVRDSVELAKTMFADQIQKKGVIVENEISPEIKFSGYSSFHEVFVNLIGNALKACEGVEKPKIEIQAQDFGSELEMVVKDNGVGIPAHVLPRLCQPFYTTKAPGEGTGLGLYVVRDVVEAQHGGKFRIQSEGVGKGACFTIRIPKEAPYPVSEPEVVLHGVSVS